MDSSVAVALGVLAVPLPRRFDDGPQLGIARLPAQLTVDLFRRRHQKRRVAGPAWPFLDRNFFTRDLLDRTNYFADAVTSADAQVVVHALPRLQLLQSQQVRLGQVVDMDVIAHAGAVRRRVIAAEHLD